MIDEPRIVETSAQRTAAVHVAVPKNEIQSVMGPGLQEVLAAVAEQGITPTGPWLSHHLRLDPDVFELEIGVPVAVPVEPAGRVKASELPAATVARAVYRGPYEGLGQAWGELRQWVGDTGHVAAPNLWEVYLSGPESSPDPRDWRTELNQPLAG